MLSWVGKNAYRDIHPIPDNIRGGIPWDCSSMNHSNRRSREHIHTDLPRTQDIASNRSAPSRFTHAVRTAFGITVCTALLVPVMGADIPLSLQSPSEVILCQPINITWTSGTPPYRLDVEPFVNNSPNKTANGRNIAIDNTWSLWTPDFPLGSILQISIEGSGTSPAASVRATELPSSNSSCLNATSASLVSMSTSPDSHSTSLNHPSVTSSPATLASSKRGLSKGAMAGIAVAVTLIGIGSTAFIAWYFLRRKTRGQHEKGFQLTIISSNVLCSDPSTLISDDRSKLTSPLSCLDSSPDATEDPDPLRPTPYLVAHESTTSGSPIRGSGGKKHMHELSDPTSTSSTANMSMSTSDARDITASPPQLGSADGQNARSGGGDGDEGGPNVVQFDPSRAPLESRSLGLGFEDVAASDLASNSGEATLPPPYSALLGGRRDDPDA